jgi:hypothetical protein
LFPVAAVFSLAVGTWSAAEPLHVGIDRVLGEAAIGPESPPASDPEFLRRAWLTLAGQIPSSAEARAFCADAAADKREKLIDRLLASAESVRHLAGTFDVMLMERRGEKHVKAAEWRRFLEDSFAANKAWDQLVREILSADGADEKTRHIARWLLEREGEPHLLTRDVGRLFLGRDMACAQCHDHPRIDDYWQRDYYGLFAFLGRTSLFQPDMKKPGVLGESAIGETTWTSVFTKLGGSTRPRLPEGDEIAEPSLAPGELWIVPPNDKDKNVRPVPKYSRRVRLAECLTDGRSPAFRRNIANRLWTLVMGRGLVEPPDLTHSLNPPAHPALLDLLADAIGVMKFDIRAFLRELALTRAFRQSFDVQFMPDAGQTIAANLPQWEAEASQCDGAARASDETFSKVRQEMENTQRAGEPVIVEWNKALAAVAETKKSSDAAEAACKQSEAAVAAKQDVLRTLADASKSAEAACKATPQDTELVTVVKTFQSRSDKAVTELAAAEKEAAAKKSDAEAKAKTLAETRQSADGKKPAAEEATQKVIAARQQLIASDSRKQGARISARQAAIRVTEAKALLAFSEAGAAARALRGEADRAQAEAASASQTIAALTESIATRLREMPALETAAVTARAGEADAVKAAQARRESAAVMADAAAKATAAAQKLPQEPDVQHAAKLVQSRAEQAAKELAELEKMAAAAATASPAAAARVSEAMAVLAKAQSDLTAATQKLPAMQAQADATAAKAADAESRARESERAFVALRCDSFRLARLTPLTPEQFSASAMKATGSLDRERAAAAAEWDQKNPMTEADKSDAAKQFARNLAIERALGDKVKAHEDQFVRLFANSAGQPQNDFFATADQALYFENAGTLRSWCNPNGDNLAGRLVKLAEPRALTEELYWSVLTRLPTDAEVADLSQSLAARPADQRAAAIADLVWALITSVEFRFRH